MVKQMRARKPAQPCDDVLLGTWARSEQLAGSVLDKVRRRGEEGHGFDFDGKRGHLTVTTEEKGDPPLSEDPFPSIRKSWVVSGRRGEKEAAKPWPCQGNLGRLAATWPIRQSLGHRGGDCEV